MRAPVPATPAMAKSPSTRALPPSTGKRAWITFLVLVWWMRTSASPSRTRTTPSSTANGPTAEVRLPQLLVQSATGLSTASCTNV